MSPTAINTKQVPRRRLRFQTIAELQEELANIARAVENRTLRVHGNWTIGQILAHLAAWINYGWEGYPVALPPRLFRWLIRWSARGWLRRGMPVGMRIPGAPTGTFGADQVPFEEGLTRLHRALARLDAGESATFDSPALGPLSHAERIQLNLRHAELHLGFVDYRDIC